MSNDQSQSISKPQQQVTYADPDPVTESLLKQFMRENLQQLLQAELRVDNRSQVLQKSFVDTVTLVLGQEEVTHSALQKSFQSMYDNALFSLQQANISEALMTQQFISDSGLVMSPLNCTHTIKDVYRLSAFFRGMDKLFAEQLSRKNGISIIYPACGPFAPLITPLLTYYTERKTFSPEQVQVTLVDVQPGAVQSLRQLVSDLEIEPFIADIVEADAVSYEPDIAFDVLILEAMQHGLSKEAQVNIAYHLGQFLVPDGVMVPHEVKVNAALVVGQEEFVSQWQQQERSHSSLLSQEALSDRVELGEVFRLNRETLSSIEKITLPDGQPVLRCHQLEIPQEYPNIGKRLLVLYATLTTYEQHSIDQYDSGITHPIPDTSVCVDFVPKNSMPDDLLLERGDSLQFFYRLQGLPGFMPVKLTTA